MFQKLSLALNGVLFAAVGVLFYLHFSEKTSTAETVVLPTFSNSGTGPRIVFVNSDSLLESYAYYKEIKKQFEAKQNRLDAELKNKGEQFQREVEAFQQKVQTQSITQEQAAAAGEVLRQKEEQLMKRRDELGQELMDEQQQFNVMLNNKVSDYLKELKKKTGYDYVFSKTGIILYANDSLDITKPVSKALNERYKAEKKK